MKHLKKITNKLLLLIAISLFLISCRDNETLPSKRIFENGVFILNEGQFKTVNASVTFYNIKDGTVTHNIYNTITNSLLGDVSSIILYS